MVHVTYHANRQAIAAEAENPHFLLTNRHGDYLALGHPNHSNYDGLFMRSGASYVKILHNIAPEQEITSLDIGHGISRATANAKQEFLLLDKGLLMEGEGKFTLTLDCKRLYDESDQGRTYEMERIRAIEGHPLKDVLSYAMLFHVEYCKQEAGKDGYAIHVGIATTMNAEKTGVWRQANYRYDQRRGTRNTPWVYDALTLEGKGSVAVATGATPRDAQQNAVTLLMTTIANATHGMHTDTPTLSTATLAWRSLESLRTNSGIMAGLPWFFQEWSRDELIASGGLLAAKKYYSLISMLDKWYKTIRPDGTLPAIYPDQGLPSSDAPGWLGKRTLDLLTHLSDEGLLHRLSKERLAHWREGTGALIDRCATRMRDGLIWSEANTTWMDTSSNDDGRQGARIEIQALFLALCDCHAYLCTITKTHVKPERTDLSRQVVEAIHARLIKDGKLLDGLHADGSQDRTVRPNIFIAWYVAPKLFKDSEWRSFFSATLPVLWLPWGGLSSIDKTELNFHAQYTGEDVASYHRGDSWYFVNNMAAMALHAVDPQGFGNEVRAILRASVRDLLTQGFAGHCSELSSAGAQEACGCHAQAWSASTLIEALLRVPDANERE